MQLTTVTGSVDRIHRRGPDLQVNANAVQNLGLVFHELATNSVKYGALSVPEGRVLIEWTFLGLSIANWSLVSFTATVLFAGWMLLRRG